MKKERESVIENYVCRKSKQWGYISRKMNGMGFNAWPDRLFVGPHKVVVWMEFKKPGKKPTPLQEEIHKRLRKLGQDVQVFDTRKEACTYLQQAAERGLEYCNIKTVEATPVPKTRGKIHGAARSRRAAA